MTDIAGLIKAVGDLRDLTSDLLSRVNRIEDRLAEISETPLTATQREHRQRATDAAHAVSEILRNLDHTEATGHDVMNVVREKAASSRARPSTELVTRVNQALEQLAAPGGYVDQLRRIEGKMDKQAEDLQTFETIVTELATAVSRTLKQQGETATKRDLLDTRGMLMVALDNLKQSIMMRAESVDVIERKKERAWPLAIVGFSAAVLVLVLLVVYAKLG